jgi:hypothetical protein
MNNLEDEKVDYFANVSKEAITKEMAIQEIQKFIEKFEETKKDEFKVENDYPQVIQAMQSGLLSFNSDSIPSFKLKYPILNEDKQVALDSVSFRTRIKPTQLRDIMKGLDIGKNQIEYTLRCLAYITGQPVAMLDKLEKFDYKVIEQVSTVFL